MATASVTIEVTGHRALVRALRALGETDAPFLKDALEEAGNDLARETRNRARGGIATSVRFAGVRGSAGRLRATVTVRHPGAKSMEFGRKYYYRGYRGRNQRSGTKFRSDPGQRADPYAGILHGDQAIGAVEPRARRLIEQAIEDEWNRVTD